MSALAIAAVAVAGALGAVARFVVDAVISRRSRDRIEWGTVIVNLSGSLALGLLVGFAASASAPAGYEAAIGGGFLGAYTTFSTWMVQSVELAERGRAREAFVHVAGSLVAGTGAAAAGLLIGSALG